jgi:hypothetical protein
MGGEAAAARASYDDGVMRDAPSDLQLQWQYYLEAKQRNDARRAEAEAEAEAAKAAAQAGAGTNGGDGGAAGLGSNLWFDILDLTKELVQKVSQGALWCDETETNAVPSSAAAAAAVRAPRATPATGSGASPAPTPAATAPTAPSPAAPAASAASSSSSSSAASSPTPTRTAAERAEAAGDADGVPAISVQTVFPPNDSSSRNERLASLTEAYSQRHETAPVSFTAKTMAADYTPSEQQWSEPKEKGWAAKAADQMQGRRRRDVAYDAKVSTPKVEPAKKKWTPPVVEVDEEAIEVVDAEEVPTGITKQNKFFKSIRNNIEDNIYRKPTTKNLGAGRSNKE